MYNKEIKYFYRSEVARVFVPLSGKFTKKIQEGVKGIEGNVIGIARKVTADNTIVHRACAELALRK
jgi:hypothetical protein